MATYKPIGQKVLEYFLAPNERIANTITKANASCALTTVKKVNEFDETATRTIPFPTATVRLSGESVKQIEKLGGYAGQILDYLIIKAHKEQSFKGLLVSTAEYMRARGLKDRQSARAQLEEGIRLLSSIKVSYAKTQSSPPAKSKEAKLREEIYGAIGEFSILENLPNFKECARFIPVVFSRLYTPVLQSSTPMAYHASLLALNTKLYPNAYAMGRKAIEHKALESRHRKEGGAGDGRSTENILSVASLLAVTPIPLYSEAEGLKKARYRAECIVPFERDLNALAEMCSWEYCRERGEPLPEGFKLTPSNFCKLFVLFHFKDYPDQLKPLPVGQTGGDGCSKRGVTGVVNGG